MRHFVPGKANKGLVEQSGSPLSRMNDVSEYIYPGIIRAKAGDSELQGARAEAPMLKLEGAACGFSEFAANAESAGAIGISSVVVLLDLTILRL